MTSPRNAVGLTKQDTMPPSAFDNRATSSTPNAQQRHRRSQQSRSAISTTGGMTFKPLWTSSTTTWSDIICATRESEPQRPDVFPARAGPVELGHSPVAAAKNALSHVAAHP